MEYRVKRSQIFRKKLPVPKEIQEHVYNKTLTIEDYIKYDLIDKVPVECIYIHDRKVVERFGGEKLKQLDFEMYNKNTSRYGSVLMLIDPEVSDLNMAFYQKIMECSTNGVENYGSVYVPILKAEDVTPALLEKMSQYFVEDVDISSDLKEKFYRGDLTLFDLVNNWDIFKNKVITGKLEYYSRDVDLVQLRKMMDEYPDIASIIQYSDTFKTIIEKLYCNATTKEQREDIV